VGLYRIENMKYIPYGKQYIDDSDIESVANVLKSDFITQGPTVEQFEKSLADYCGAKFAVVFNSGTSALHAAYFALGLGEGDSFITTPMTFAATSNAGLYLGAKPIFADIEPDTGNIDTDKIENLIDDNTKLISVVHYSGHPVDMKKLKEIALKYDLKVVEDACHALGGKYDGEKIGNCKYSDATVLSFHPVKHITTGEGGAVLTNDEEVYKKLLLFRSHGITKDSFEKSKDGDWYYEMQILGFNYRMTDLQAALGISQLRKIDMFVERRRKIVDLYNQLFNGNIFFDIPIEKDYAYHAYHLYPIRLKDTYVKKKTEIFSNLRRNGIGVQVHYIPVYFHPYYDRLGYNRGLAPLAEDFYFREISLPIYYTLTDDDLRFVVSQVYKVMESL